MKAISIFNKYLDDKSAHPDVDPNAPTQTNAPSTSQNLNEGASSVSQASVKQPEVNEKEQSASNFKAFAANVFDKRGERDNQVVAQGNAGLGQLFSQGQCNAIGRG
jgi:hypothetical protein